jgi:uncharacterized membrane protein YukC
MTPTEDTGLKNYTIDEAIIKLTDIRYQAFAHGKTEQFSNDVTDCFTGQSSNYTYIIWIACGVILLVVLIVVYFMFCRR